MLVFLSGEREIRDTADALAARLRSDIDILPLYSRLSTREQQRVFRPHEGRRVVLATNVAETSLTVPGIRYVVDPGTARISRYSARLKVQRLPIEPVSQASADQRKGRCGRTSDGICVRLYAEEDFDGRPRFTDPEILRTNLASVLLQMAAAGLGDVEDFPFLDPPDRRQVRDGVRLLQELAAFDDAERLTPLGRRLAQLPVDPRLGRMVLEADRLGCAGEVIVIAAALSIQDPRERPADKREEADRHHARFAAEGSDFLAYVNLWSYVREQQRALSGNQFRKLCHGEFLHHLRVREWQDLVGQLRQAAKGVGVTLDQEPAEPEAIHTALLAGLLSQLGMRDAAKRDYLGARGARFALFPGSALARKQPSWVMVAELVETSRLWGRTAAKIDPLWVEPLAAHLIKRSYEEPHWERKRASVVALERATLYGLPVVAGRKVAYGEIDPELSRSLFIRRALVEGDWETRHAFFAANRDLLAEVEELEHRARRRDIVVSDQALYDFYDARIPPEVVSGAHFDRWWKDERRRSPALLDFTRADVLADAADALDRRALPEAWRQGEFTLPLSYVFDPGSERDGVTVHVPLKLLPQLEPIGFDWLVPALRPELVTALIRSLPKDLRRPLVPVPEVAEAVLERLEPRSEPLLDGLARELERLRGVRVPRAAFDPGRLPPHLRMRFRVEDERGALVAEGDDLDALREQARPRLREALSAAAAPLERHGLREWTIGPLPKVVALPGTGQAVRGYPALVDEGDAVGVRVLETAAAQSEAMHAGTRKLIALNVPSPIRHVQGRLGNAAQLALAGAPHASPRAVLEDATVAALEALIAEAGGPAWDEPGFARLRAHVAGNLAERTAAGRRRRRAGPRRRARGRAAAGAARSRARAGAGARGRRAPAAAARVPRLRQRDRRRPAGRRRALPARGRAPARAAAERAGSGPRPHARGAGAGGRARAPARRLAARPAAPGRAARGAVDARGAAREPFRAGSRHARAGVEQADPARARAGGRVGARRAPARRAKLGQSVRSRSGTSARSASTSGSSAVCSAASRSGHSGAVRRASTGRPASCSATRRRLPTGSPSRSSAARRPDSGLPAALRPSRRGTKPVSRTPRNASVRRYCSTGSRRQRSYWSTRIRSAS